MKYRLREVDFNANGNFSSTPAEEWIIGNKKIISVHGTLKVSDTKIVEHNGLVGIQLSVKGKLDLSNFPNGRVLAIETIAFLRQPHNVWLWGYAFDKNRHPIVNFCGYDDLDGLPSLFQLIKGFNYGIS